MFRPRLEHLFFFLNLHMALVYRAVCFAVICPPLNALNASGLISGILCFSVAFS